MCAAEKNSSVVLRSLEEIWSRQDEQQQARVINCLNLGIFAAQTRCIFKLWLSQARITPR